MPSHDQNTANCDQDEIMHCMNATLPNSHRLPVTVVDTSKNNSILDSQLQSPAPTENIKKQNVLFPLYLIMSYRSSLHTDFI